MSTTEYTAPAAAVTAKGGTWIEDWRPEDDAFWENGGKAIAKRNLLWSIFAEHLGFSVWLLWSVSAALMVAQRPEFLDTFNVDPTGKSVKLFYLIALPNLVGSLVRIPYTFAVPKFGGRNWTVISALLLLIPTVLFTVAVQNAGTPYWAFMVIAATAGFGGGNFASSMANINFFYPAKAKGAALGLNAAGGNLGVALIQFFLPIIVGAGGAFGLVVAAKKTNAMGKLVPDVHLEYVGYLYAGLAIVAALGAFFFMNNLREAKSSPKEQLAVLKQKHTWVMSFLYIGTFGSFIGYSAAMPLLLKINFFRAPVPTAPIGINFVWYAFLGALVGSIARPFGGWLADKYGGAKVTVVAFTGMILGTLGVWYTLTQMKSVAPPDPEKLKAWKADPTTFPGWDANPFLIGVHDAVTWNANHIFPVFLTLFLLVFAFTGIGNGSTYRMIPLIQKHKATEATEEGTQERHQALLAATKESSAVIGFAGSIGALGGFLIPIVFTAPWVANPVDSIKSAFLIFTAFYVICLGVTYWFFLKKSGKSLGHVKI
ncbi:MFS transporter [Nocardioides jejuensis]|uniref:NarK/NasA family nitrate transporter n=1 Tax=Nocardioides jejuensis TaxID=2502782 RepID=A0A4R1CG37_9ACTN|nr:nitrate/nitrite transporter [Nocardioides jejuensis]TCJ30293.1 NarK/NasA family nitrate transporter [Nocardioides jejuensis]